VGLCVIGILWQNLVWKIDGFVQRLLFQITQSQILFEFYSEISQDFRSVVLFTQTFVGNVKSLSVWVESDFVFLEGKVLVALSFEFLKLLHQSWIVWISFSFLNQLDELWNLVGNVDLSPVFQLNSVGISLIPHGYNLSLSPSVGSGLDLARNYVSNFVGKLFSDAVFEAVYQVVPVNVFAYEAKVGLPGLCFVPPVPDEVACEQHMNSLKDVGTVHTNHVDHSFVSV